MRYCDSCTENPAKKKITAEMAELFRMDPQSKVCPSCFDSMQRQIRASR